MGTLTFSGHRSNKLNGYNATDWVRDRLADVIHRAYRAGYRHFICCGALGTDWIAADEILSLNRYADPPGLKLTLALPFKGYNSKWSLDLIDRFEYDILTQADEVVYVCDPGYAVWKYQKRNEWAIDRCKVLIAVWDGDSEGGTANAVHYATDRVKIYRIDPKTKKRGLAMKRESDKVATIAQAPEVRVILISQPW